MAFSLDHVVINTLFDMDVAETLMARLGFTLTPRGYHSLGSINHLIMFEGHYLELVGLPSGTDVLRQEVLESPRGLNGLVFQASDIDATVAQLQGSKLAILAPQSFSRPVTLDGIEQLARFRTVRTASELFEAGRVYYCQHYTPELVWRREWMSHANGSTGLSELVVVTETADADLLHYSKAAQAAMSSPAEGVWTVDLPDSFRITLLSLARYRERYGQLCVDAGGRRSFFGAIVLKAPDLGRIPRDPAVLAGLRASEAVHSLALSVPCLNTLLEFRNDR
ncbi:VOC family protein [Bradyrhizobium sp. KBS0727]|uniref:VOC family protein n=1 Tax=unclassified Bradyrhizobium TaxID=2631580 RepID=UPI00110E27E5|nr:MULTISPECIES: VOC family protein [unclassified Bradyrhizobium]QDW36882.1 VOC family protein [Bradyrhizobium sp. KBS0725]QDW43482.1 VOC family protein [Bradyrhizobium sp. KBS0727]